MDVNEGPDGGDLEAWLRAEMAELRGLEHHDPFANPVLLLAVQLEQRWADGACADADVDALIARLTLEASLERAERLRHYLGESDPAANARRQAALFEALPDDFDAFRDCVERPRYGFVFTAHPTFAHAREVHVDLLSLALDRDEAGRSLGDDGRTAIVERLGRADHRPPRPIDLDVEHRLAMAAIERVRTALDDAHRRLFTVARARFPDRWRDLRPRLASVATWVGYDLDGRADIPWRTTFAKRLEVQARELEALRARVQALEPRAAAEPNVAAPLELAEARLALALKTTREGAAVMTGDGADGEALARLAAWSREVVAGDGGRLVSARPLAQIVERALARCGDDDLALELAVIAADLESVGLGRARTHLRINAVQLHNAVRRQLDMDHPPDDPSYRLSYLDAVSRLIAQVEPVTVHFGSIDAERTTARRVFMLMAQLVKVVDADEPLRFLIAETESAFTLLVALYFAKLFGIDDRVDLSPLFETEKALERGVEVVREALAREPYRAYVERRGRLCLQTGYSDAGRYLGQTAAAVKIERLKLDVVELLDELGLGDVEVVVFDTHGESIGRGGNPASFADRLAYLHTAETRRRVAARGRKAKQETSFQGSDGYLLFTHPVATEAVVTRVLEHVLTPPPNERDPFYAGDVYAAEFFTVIERFGHTLIDDPDYAALLGAFGANMLERTGSRAMRRQHEGGAPQHLGHPSQLRAIPHNAILQQLGFLANSLGGAGAAVAKDPDRFRTLYAESERFRRLVAMIEHAFKYSDAAVLRAHIDLLDPAMWLLRGSRARELARQEGLRATAASCERLGAHEKLTRIFRALLRDHLDLDHVLRHHRRAQREQGEAPIVVGAATRDNMHLLNAVRLACMLRLFALAAHIPDFSGRYELTREELIAHVFHLDVDRVVEVLRRIFPYAPPSGRALDWGETATYLDSEGESYRREHEEIFIPMDCTAERIRRVSVALVHHLGAVG